MTFEPHMHASGKRMCIQAIYRAGFRQTMNCAELHHNMGEDLHVRSDAAPLLPAGTIVQSSAGTTTRRRIRERGAAELEGLRHRSIDDMMFNLGKYIALTEDEYKAELAAPAGEDRRTTKLRRKSAAKGYDMTCPCRPDPSSVRWQCCSRRQLILTASHGVSGQLQYSSGQEVTPDYSGWEANADGSFDMISGT